MSRLLALPAYALNGIAVAIGVACINLVIAALAGTQAATFALGTAVCTSLADVPNTVARTANRVTVAAIASVASTAVTWLLLPTPLAMGVGVMLIAFGAMMAMAWGPRAGAAAFAPILALIFTMAAPPGSVPLGALLLWSAVLGGMGTLLALPLTLLVKSLVIDSDPNARWVNALIAVDPKDAEAEPGDRSLG